MKNCLFIFFIGLISACGGAGSGDGLDDNGLPVDNDNTQPTPDPDETDSISLQRIQNEIFGAICAECHTGTNAPRGLRLDTIENSFNFLVGIESDEVPELLRVEPGNPDASYLIKKIEGAADIVGSQMPLGRPALSEAHIQLVRDWINNDATFDTATRLKAHTNKANLISVANVADEIQFTVYFEDNINPSSVTQDNIFLYLKNNGSLHMVDRQEYEVSSNRETLSVHYHGNTLSFNTLVLQIGAEGIDGIRDSHNMPVDLQVLQQQEGNVRYEIAF